MDLGVQRPAERGNNEVEASSLFNSRAVFVVASPKAFREVLRFSEFVFPMLSCPRGHWQDIVRTGNNKKQNEAIHLDY